jgi:apolipoprotein N-acyltransferase
LVGWAAGSVFFTINYAWFGETAGSLIAPFGFFMTLGPGIGDAFFGFGLAGLAIAHLQRRAPPALVPLGAAAIFAFAEWLRAEGLGVLGVPFGSLGYSAVDSPFAPLGAFVGTYGITFVLATIGAYAAYAIRMQFARPALTAAATAYLAVVVASALAWYAWPAKTYPAPTFRVAAVQGNIAQSLKFTPRAYRTALARYTSLTLGLARAHPRLIVWPETVIIKALGVGPASMYQPADVYDALALQQRFGDLAKRVGAELVVGSFDVRAGKLYNALFFFRPDGGLDAVYHKRQLVPFAEHTPGRQFLSWIPWTANISNIEEGDASGVIDVGGVHVGPIVCWESAFSGLVVGDARDGASALLIATDDAWFGTTAGPYQHAQIARMRAIETGRWILRSASTGISGIIAPDGRYVTSTQLNVATVVTGALGAPVPTLYDAVGPGRIALALLVLSGGIVLWPRRRAHR